MKREQKKFNSFQAEIENTLGIVKHIYFKKSHPWIRWFILLLGATLSILGIGSSYLLFQQIYVAIHAHGRAIIMQFFPWPILFYCVLFITGLILIIYTKRIWVDRIEIYENGLIIKKANKSKVLIFQDIVRFDSFLKQVIFSGSIVNTRIKVILKDKHGFNLILRNRYAQMEELISQLREIILPDLTRRLKEDLDKGGSIWFHKNIEATQAGLKIKHNFIPYDELEITFQSQILILNKTGTERVPVYKSPISKFSNLDTLINLINESD